MAIHVQPKTRSSDGVWQAIKTALPGIKWFLPFLGPLIILLLLLPFGPYKSYETVKKRVL